MQTSSVELTGAAGPACASHASCAEGALCTRGRCDPITAQTTECRDVLVRFARGTVALGSSAEDTVERLARCLKAERTPTVTIEASDDPSRSKEDNAAVTKTRFATVRQGLEQRGVPPDRIDAVRLVPSE
jgi:outer membrane protein OmpA-like peptidoglycan-associated protein